MTNINIISAIHDVGMEVRNFSKHRNGTYNWSCEICGDSITNQRKARFGVANKQGVWVCHCFNCGYSNTFIAYTKDFHPRVYEQINADNFFDKAPILYDLNPLIKKVPVNTLINIFFIKKFKQTSEWANFIHSKKIQLSADNMRKLELLHNKYWELQK